MLFIVSEPIPVTSGNFIAIIPHIKPAYAGMQDNFLEPKLFKKLRFLFVRKKEYKLAKRPARIPANIIITMFIGLFPVTLGISNVSSYLKTSTVKKYEIIEDKRIGEKLAKDWCLNTTSLA